LHLRHHQSEAGDLWLRRAPDGSKVAHRPASYLIAYQGFTILHLGDAQGDISSIREEEVRLRMKALFAVPIDLLLLPIGWTRDIIAEAEAVVELLQPRRVIPMHYWSPQEKRDFLTRLAARNESAGTRYQVREIAGPGCDIRIAEANVTPVQVISLEPAPFDATHDDMGFR